MALVVSEPTEATNLPIDISREARPGANIIDTGISVPEPDQDPRDKWDHSHLHRNVIIWNEQGTEAVSVACYNTTPAVQLRATLAMMLGISEDDIQLKKKQGPYIQGFGVHDTVVPVMSALGVKSWIRKEAPVGEDGPKGHRYEHPILIIGAGLGGIIQMQKLENAGRKDFICVERHSDFGGSSWICAANKFTKLQTEKGCYYFNFMEADGTGADGHLEDGSKYTTWPSRDQILQHFREHSYWRGLQKYTRFNTQVEKVKVIPGPKEKAGDGKKVIPGWQPGRAYSVMTVPTAGLIQAENYDTPAGDGELMMCSAICSWPGNFAKPNLIEIPGEDNFGGYIEYASFNKVDYTMAEGKNVVLWGHGAFAIENVRTLLEHKAAKVYVVCRKRNLAGMKIASWLADVMEAPLPGQIMMKVFNKMYMQTYNYNTWEHPAVKTDEKQSYCHITTKTIFGVTDIYFLAGQYGLCEIVESNIKRLARKQVFLESGRRINAEVIVKAVGTRDDGRFDKILGVKELHGFWANGDPLRPVVCGSIGVNARNFASFSFIPGIAAFVTVCSWFIERPEDFAKVQGLPVRRKTDGGDHTGSCYVPTVMHVFFTTQCLGSLPDLMYVVGQADRLKSTQVARTHPIEEYLSQCKAEWDTYIGMFKKNGQIPQDAPHYEYPYSLQYIDSVRREVDLFYGKKFGMVPVEDYNNAMAGIQYEQQEIEKYEKAYRDSQEQGNKPHDEVKNLSEMGYAE